MPVQWTFARSRVTRHLLLIFVTCAIGPIGLLAAWTYHQVTEQLYQQSQLRLHQASKASALAILDRLQLAERELKALGETVDGSGDAELLRTRARPLHPLFESVALLRGGREPLGVFGSPPQSPSLSADGAAHIGAGGTLLVTERRADGSRRTLLVRRRAPGSRDLLAGVLHVESILDLAVQTSLPPQAEFCLLDERHELLHCSVEDPPAIPAAVKAKMEVSISGGFDWQQGDRSYVARYWSVLLAPSFHAASWTLVLAEPRDEVLAPIAAFRTTFPPAVAACLLLVSLLSISLIRRRLEPLERLREGTRRIGERDFDANIRVTSGDEFEDLAESFNAMSQRLRGQFDCLDAMIEIDRAILASLDPPSIADTVVSRIRSIYPCDVACMLLCGADPGGPIHAFLSRDRMDTVSAERVTAFSAEQRRWLALHREHLVLDAADRSLHFLEPMRRADVATVLVLPLFVDSELAGAILCGHAAGSAPVSDRIDFARQLANQASMALFNAFTIAQNRVLAYFDALTGLPNRLLFKERTEQALVVAKRRGDRLAVCVLDLDDFKRVNDTLGHDAGDRLLKEVASRISGILRSGTLARLGGDEFTILVREMESIEDPARVAAKVLDELARPFGLPGREVFITGSIGIAVHPVDGDDLDTLMRNADAAMYHAKDDGGGAYHFYTPSMHAAALERLTLEGDLRHAIERGELRLEYQPVVETRSRELIGAEAMLRWQHPVRGVIYPDDFISLAEDSGLIVPIGAWALRTACAQSRKWQLAGLRPLRISVNLSSRQLRDAALVETVRGALSDSGLYAEHLALELTESMLMDASEETLRCFREVKQMGVQLSLDDFGVGYSSLSYLRQFPLDYVKIDRSFIDEVSGNSEDAAIVRAILAMAHSLKLRVVAEGVEREDQFAFLREHGCDAVQGFLFSEPLPPDAFTKLLAGLDPR